MATRKGEGRVVANRGLLHAPGILHLERGFAKDKNCSIAPYGREERKKGKKKKRREKQRGKVEIRILLVFPPSPTVSGAKGLVRPSKGGFATAGTVNDVYYARWQKAGLSN